ncbi:MAG: hypothetical protein ACREIB_10780 [Pseudomonadota bacterium]
MTRRLAGMGGHQSARARTDVWLTPPAVLEAIGGWESFDLDPCAPATRPWPMALLLPRSFAVIALPGAEQTWREIVVDLMRKRSGPVPLDELYRALAHHPNANERRHYQAKIRQVLQQGRF